MSEEVKSLRPIFTGRTAEGEEISLFQHIDKPEEIHILLPESGVGGLWSLPKNSEISTWKDPMSQEMRVDIVSSVWTGQAIGSRWHRMKTDSL